MLQRTSSVDRLNMVSVTFGSTIEIGDSSYLQGFSRALAIQRETDVFYGNEGDFERFPIFTFPISFQPLEEEIIMYTEHLHPVIKVNTIDIVGVAASSIVHIGSSKHISMESRVKHVRQLLSKE